MTRIVLTNILLVICLLLLETRVTHDVPRAFEKLAIVELSQHADVINVFHSANLTLFTASEKEQERQKLGNKMKNDRLFQTSYKMISIFCTKSICIKS